MSPARLLVTAAALLFLALPAVPAAAQHRLCDPADEDCREILINHIRAEKVGLDVAFWFMEDHWIAAEVIDRWEANVPVRILMDTQANSPNPINIDRLAEFEAAGIPMRERTASGILHWKMMLFAGQNVVQFSGANYSSDAFVPSGPDYTNYVDEVILFTSDPDIVNSFKTKYDDLWTNTTTYTDYRNITRPLWRVYPTYPIHESLNFVPDQSYFSRAAADFRNEPTGIDAIMYRITDNRFTQEMIAAKQRGVQVRLMTEPDQYRDVRRIYHSYNVDLLYMAGVEIRHRTHAGLNHQKSVVLRGLNTGIVGSSNWSNPSAEYQEEHNLFTQDSNIYDWLVAQFERKWHGLSGVQEYGPFTPLPPDQAHTPSPASGTSDIPVDNVVLSWDAGPWAHRYDVYLGTDAGAMELVGADLHLGPSQWAGDFKRFVVPVSLKSGTTYYWRIVSRTMADMTTTSPNWSFTTAADTSSPSPPSSVTVVRQPYLQQVTPTGATVVWATRESGTAELRIAAPSGVTTTATAASTLVPASATGLAADYYQHVARVEGLAPGTSYQYDILLDSADLNASLDTLRTAPATGTGTVSFVAWGDSGTGSTEQQQIAAMIAGDSFDFAVHGGDLAYGSSDGTGGATYQTMDDWVFAMYGGWMRSRPFFPSLGNHDSRASNGDGVPYLDLFSLPTNGASTTYPDHAERYYSFDYGPVHVVVLDTELAFQDLARRSAQVAWLEADLASTTQPWKVAVFHRSPYSAGGEHGSDLTVRQVFGDVFDQYGVQLVISAHEHTYERTVPMRAGVPAEGGTTYIVSGGGGAPLYPAGTAEWTAYSASVHHYVKATATECTLRVDAVSISGGALDRVDLSRCEEAPALPAPWTSRDIGAVGPAGSATESSGTFTVNGAGADIWNTADAFHYVSQPISGDVDVVARVASIEYVANWVKAGVMIREALTPDSAHALMLVSPGKGLAFQRRVATGGLSTHTTGGSGTAPNWVKLERRGNTITAFRSPDGVTWTLVGSDTFSMAANVEVGLAVSSHDATQLAEAIFDNVTVTAVGTPPPANVAPTVALSSPADGATFTAPASVAITANASDSDGTISRVDFYAGSTFLGSDTTGPYEWTWNNVAAGTYSLTARAVDDAGAQTTSAAVSVTVDPAPNTAPSISISSPVGGATFTAPASIAITAAAADSDGTVARVDFYAGGTLLGSDSSSPYEWVWSDVPAGTYSLTARATDDDGAQTTSTAVSITVNEPATTTNAAPAVSVSSPANGATFTAPATVAIAATASDTDGTIARVDFYSGSTLLGTDTSSPYEWSWTDVPAGTYTLTTRATDDDGAQTTSAAVSITVEAPPPTSALPTPWESQDIGAVGVAGSASASEGTFTILGAGADIWNSADAFHYVWQPLSGDADVIARVTSIEYVANWVKAGVMIRETLTPESAHALMLVSAGKGLAFQRRVATGGVSTHTTGGSGTAPNWVKLERRGNTITGYRSADGVTWALVGSDSFTMPTNVYVGLAVSSHDATRTATVTIDNVSVVPATAPPPANLAPSVALTSPADGATFEAPASITLAASASDSDGTVSRVDFYNGTTLLGSDTSSPYQFAWSSVAAGAYSLTARAVDNAGAATTSAPVSITVNAPSNVAPSVALTSPADGATFTAPASITLAASASDSDGTVSRVDFYNGTTLLGSDTSSPYQFDWTGISAGSYSVTARAVDNAGAQTSSSPVSITVNEPAESSALPLPWQAQDVGNVGPAGSASYGGGTFTLSGAGADIWGYADAFHYAWQQITGDVDIVARVTSVENVHAWVKAAVMIREQLTPESAHAMMLVSAGKGLAFQRRVSTSGASTHTSGGAGTAPAWIKLERRNNTITAYRSADGVTWTLVGSDTFSMGTNVYVGLAVTSHDATQLATVTFDNVSVTPR